MLDGIQNVANKVWNFHEIPQNPQGFQSLIPVAMFSLDSPTYLDEIFLPAAKYPGLPRVENGANESAKQEPGSRHTPSSVHVGRSTLARSASETL